MKCTKCGIKLEAGAKFCSACGNKVISEMRFCRECGEKIQGGSKFCSFCGANLTISDDLVELNDSDFSKESDFKVDIKKDIENAVYEERMALEEEEDFAPWQSSNFAKSNNTSSMDTFSKNNSSIERKGNVKVVKTSDYKNTSNLKDERKISNNNHSVPAKKKKSDDVLMYIIVALAIIFILVGLIVSCSGSEENKSTASVKSDPPVDNKQVESNDVDSSKASDDCYYSTNSSEEAKNGNSGIFAYVKRGQNYDQYRIINFDDNCVDSFIYYGDDCGEGDRVQMDGGDLNSVLLVTYHDGEDEWQESYHFHYRNMPHKLIMEDYLGFENEFIPTDLSEALQIESKLIITNY